MTFQLSLDIAASPATVFDFVADFRTTPRWYSAVQGVDRIGDGSGLGTRYEVRRQLPGGPARNEVEITTYESGREVTFTSLSGPTPFVYRYLVEPGGRGTLLTLEGTISGAGLPRRFPPRAAGRASVQARDERQPRPTQGDLGRLGPLTNPRLRSS